MVLSQNFRYEIIKLGLRKKYVQIFHILLCFSATLFRDLTRKDMEEMVTSEVKFRMLCLWLPVLCHAQNGLTFPALMMYEKDDTEIAVNQVIGTLSPTDQEVIITNWLRDYAISTSEWPNLQPAYDRWCNSTRQFIV